MYTRDYCCLLSSSETLMIVGDARNVWSAVCGANCFRSREQSQRVDENVVIFFGFVMKIVPPDAEIQGTAEVRCQSKFLTQLPSMFVR